MFPSKLVPAILLILLASLPVAAAAPPAMYFRDEGGLSAYRFAVVAITSDGQLTCEIEYLSQHSKSTLALTKQEMSYFRSGFERVLSLPQASVAKTGVETGETTWRMTEEGKTRELTYRHTQNAWCRALTQEMWRIIRRETALLALLPEANVGRRHGACNVASDLRDGLIFRPESLRGPLVDALGRWPSAEVSFWRNRDMLVWLLHALAYAESREQWAGDIEELYASRPRPARVIILRTLSDWNFLSDLRDHQGRVLVPLLLKGLEELLADSVTESDKELQRTVMDVTIALGNLRDARAIEVLSSDRLWALEKKPAPGCSAGRSLAQIGLAGVEALLPKASAPDESTRQPAEWTLQYAVQHYTSDPHILPSREGPSADEASRIRDFLEVRGYRQVEPANSPPG